MPSKIAERIAEEILLPDPMDDCETVEDVANMIDRILAEHKIELRPMEELTPSDGQVLIFYYVAGVISSIQEDAGRYLGDCLRNDIGWLPLSRFGLGGDERE